MSNQQTTQNTENDLELSTKRLRDILTKEYPDNFMIFIDLFSLGCLLHLKGDTAAGYKIVNQILGAVSRHEYRPYLESIIENLSGNEVYFGLEVEPHYEINQLFSDYRNAAYRKKSEIIKPV